MTRIALLAVALCACTGSTYYPSSQPQYASSTSSQTTQHGSSTTTTTTTSTYQSSSHEEEPPPPPPEPEPAPVSYEPPPPPSADPRCDRRDSVEMCIALGVLLDVGDILREVEDRSCRKASKALNRYADGHAREIEILLTIEQRESPRRLAEWQQRHQAIATVVIGRAVDLDVRCDRDDRVGRALKRIGFRGLMDPRR